MLANSDWWQILYIGPSRGFILVVIECCLRAAKNAAHHLNQVCYTFIVDKIVNPIGFFFVIENALVSQYCQVLGNIALTRANLLNDLLYANRVIAEYAKDFQAQRMRHRFQAARGPINIVVVV